jgi:ribose transport system substrate-binding protein
MKSIIPTRSKHVARLAGILALLAAGVASLVVAASGFAATPMQQAQAILDASKAPTTIAVTVKSTKPYPKGKKVIFIHSGNVGGTTIAGAIRSAIKGMGLDWKFTVVPTNGSPESVQDGWKTAIRLKPDAIFGVGFPRTMFNAQLLQAKAMGIPFFQVFTLDPPGNGITLSVGGDKDVRITGHVMAAWVALQTAGKANVLLVDIPTFPILIPVGAQFKKDLATFCTGCPVATMNMPVSALGVDAPDRIASFVRAHPKVNYIVYTYDGVGVGVPAALKAAGVADRVKIVGASPSAENLGYIAAGLQEATVAQGFYELWASVVDAAARAMTGQSVAPDKVPPPFFLFTKSSKPKQNGFDGPVVPGLYAKYKALWPAK